MTLLLLSVLLTGACSTAPPIEDRPLFLREAEKSVAWFKWHHPEIRDEMEAGAGYAIFPSVDQWGYGLGGGRWGRGVVYRPDGEQMGWAAINASCWGMQVGVQEYRMLLIFDDEPTLRRYQHDTIGAFVSGAGVAGEAGRSDHDDFFEDHVKIYHASNVGLMVGVNVGLELMRFEPTSWAALEPRPRLPDIPLPATVVASPPPDAAQP
ncbi:MAG: hypothetical protein KDA21_00160 [Phycisphaerales bacterium]|nr:hypothetical protein [Phycisphaerales bacterium]